MRTRGFIRRAVAAIGAVCAAVLLALPGEADAGSYTVYTCRLPDGTGPAPTDGWIPEGERVGLRLVNSCPSQGTLSAEMDAVGFGDTVRGSWRWSASPGTLLREMVIWRTFALGQASAEATPFRDVLSDSRQLDFDATAPPPLGTGNPSDGSETLGFHPTNRVDHRDLRDNVIRIRLGCNGPSGSFCPIGGAASVQYIFAAHFLIDDFNDPVAGVSSGTLAHGGVHRGTESVTFEASDQGTGVYRGIVEVDGIPVQTEILDDNGGRCVDARPGDADPYQFLHRMPCKPSANGTLRFDTRTIPDGPHELRIRVEDAAGNRATVYGAEPITVDNVPDAPLSDSGGVTQPAVAGNALVSLPPLGLEPSRAATLLALPKGRTEPRIRIPFGRRVRISGLLNDAGGQPIGGARIDVGMRLRTRGGQRHSWAHVTTDRSGRFEYVVPAGPSRTIDFSYRNDPRSPTPTATASVDLRVRAGVTLKLSHRRLRNGRVARYFGRLAGIHVGRKYVDVQVLVGRQWRPVCSASTDARGRYACRYRFRRTFQRTAYTFRARVRRQETLPYEPAVSASRRLLVLP